MYGKKTLFSFLKQIIFLLHRPLVPGMFIKLRHFDSIVMRVDHPKKEFSNQRLMKSSSPGLLHNLVSVYMLRDFYHGISLKGP